jgi:type I restriction enzyme R subunit
VISRQAIWNEEHLAELPALELLALVGYQTVEGADLAGERGTERMVVLPERVGRALRRLNPWLTDDGVRRATRAITHIDAATLIEANEIAWERLAYGTTVEVTEGKRRVSRSVRYFDWDNPGNNEFMAVRQLRVAGTKKAICADVVAYVNGIPLAVIECKAPTLGPEWLHEATDQLERYQELGERWHQQGAPHLFHTVQVVVASCGQRAFYATVATPGRWFAEWKSLYPFDEAHLAARLRERHGRDLTPQDTLLAGMLAPEVLLDLTRNFIAYDAEGGRRVKKLARYQQYRAVNRAMARITSQAEPAKRGGVVWHTQGSGKSLTMLWLALKLRRQLENPTIVIVTDRRDLDNQISATFRNCGFPNPVQAQTVKHLRELLRGGAGQTIMTTIQKFQDALEAGRRQAEHPVLNDSPEVFVMVDEAHRTQYKNLAGNMRAALPNACFLGFTGTPIDKKDRSTPRTFGWPYIDTYTIREAVEDGATVPIFFESRLPDVQIQGGETLDQLFDRMFSDLSPAEREKIKRRYGTETAIAGAPQRIKRICLDIIEHYDRFIAPNGFKAQIVAATRDIAVTYKETLDVLHGPASALIMSSTNDDTARLARWQRSRDEIETYIRQFKDRDDPLKFIIVCDMLLTGFDAPVEQVMYLDSPLREHTLLQAIARVNRTADGKTYGLVVDYWGVLNHLTDALAIFEPRDVQQAMAPLEDNFAEVQVLHRAATRFFSRVNRDDLDACIRALEPEDTRAQFDDVFSKFAKSMDMLLPDPRALKYRADLQWLTKVRLAARARFRDQSPIVSDAGDKVRLLIAEYIGADGVKQLLEPISILSPKFEEELARLPTAEAKASEMEHAIKYELKIRFEENPVFYQSLRERLEEILEERRQERISSAEQLRKLGALKTELESVGNIARSLNLSETGFAMYELLLLAKRNGDALPRVAEDHAIYHGERDEDARALAESVEQEIAVLAVIDWRMKDDVQREMRRRIKRRLRAAGFDGERLDALANGLLDIARRGLPR